MEERIREIVKDIRADVVFGHAPDQEVDYVQAILTAVAESLPGAIDEDGSQGKWVNGWNDYRDEVLAQLGKEEK